MKTGIELIAEERQEQIEKHGYDVIKGDCYDECELAEAAYAYLIYDPNDARSDGAKVWPWDDGWNPKDRISNLVRAGALIAAEIDRLNHIQK